MRIKEQGKTIFYTMSANIVILFFIHLFCPDFSSENKAQKKPETNPAFNDSLKLI